MTDKLREAAQAALGALERARAYVYETERPQIDASMDDLRAALAEQDAEPVAWQYVWAPGMYYTTDSRATLDRYVSSAEDRLAPEKRGYVRALYTHPPRRQWQSLTDEERMRLYNVWMDNESTDSFDLMNSVEAALKEKNHD